MRSWLAEASTWLLLIVLSSGAEGHGPLSAALGRSLLGLDCSVAVQYEILTLNATSIAGSLTVFNNKKTPLLSWHVTWLTGNSSALVLTQYSPVLASSASASLSSGPISSVIPAGASAAFITNATYYATSEDVSMGINTVAVNGLPCQSLTAVDAKPSDSTAVHLGYNGCSLRQLHREQNNASLFKLAYCIQSFCCDGGPELSPPPPTPRPPPPPTSPGILNPQSILSPAPSSAEVISVPRGDPPVSSPNQNPGLQNFWPLPPPPVSSPAAATGQVKWLAAPTPAPVFSSSLPYLKLPSAAPKAARRYLASPVAESYHPSLAAPLPSPQPVFLQPDLLAPAMSPAVSDSFFSPAMAPQAPPSVATSSASSTAGKPRSKILEVAVVGAVAGLALALTATAFVLRYWRLSRKRALNCNGVSPEEAEKQATVLPFNGGMHELTKDRISSGLWDISEPGMLAALPSLRHLKQARNLQGHGIAAGRCQPSQASLASIVDNAPTHPPLPPRLRHLYIAQPLKRRWSWGGEKDVSSLGNTSVTNRTMSENLEPGSPGGSLTASSISTPFGLERTRGTGLSLQCVIPPPLLTLTRQQWNSSAKSPMHLDIDFAREITLEERIGAGAFGTGAFGTVYKGKWQGRAVAVKIMLSSCLGESSSELESFRQEVRVLSSLQHKRIVCLLGVCMAPPNLCLVEELAVGGSLYDKLHASGRNRGLPHQEVLQIALDVADAMAYLHPAIVHRDLKSSNVLLDEHGRAQISDFGIAAFKERTFISTRNAQAGTPSYMAPEMFEGSSCRLSEKIDQYAFAMLLWEALTGQVPWKNMSSPMQVIYVVGVLKKRPRIPADCPAGLCRLLKDCWHDNPECRPPFTAICHQLQVEQKRLHDQME